MQDLSDQALLSVYQKEIAKLRRELEENRLKATAGIDPSSVVDKSVLEDLQQKHSELSHEKVKYVLLPRTCDNNMPTEPDCIATGSTRR